MGDLQGRMGCLLLFHLLNIVEYGLFVVVYTFICFVLLFLRRPERKEPGRERSGREDSAGRGRDEPRNATPVKTVHSDSLHTVASASLTR